MSTQAIPAASVFRRLFEMTHHYLEATMRGVNPAALSWSPQPGPASILGQYAHVVTSEDWLINVKAKGSAPLMATTFAGRTGFQTPPPPVGWNGWDRQQEIDVDALRLYAQTVYVATDHYLATINDDELSRPVDMSEVGMGQVMLSDVLMLATGNSFLHTGEISALKGLCGLTGYPEMQVEAESVLA
jgi:hypothetical protein